MTLTEFLLARITEDEYDARTRTLGRGWRKQWLGDCEAKRQIVEAALARNNRDRYGGCGDDCEWKALDYAVAWLSLPYAAHPDYREEWRP